MSNGFFFTPEEHYIFSTDITVDDKGNIVYGPKAKKVVDHAIERAQRESGRQDRTNLDDDHIDIYKFRMAIVMKREPGIGVTTVSEKIGLGRSTVRNNPKLFELYNNILSGFVYEAPVTLDNDPWENWDYERE